MVSHVEAIHYCTGEPRCAVGEDRQTVRTRVPITSRKLVDLVARPRTEEASYVLMLAADHVDGKMLCGRGNFECVVLLRQPGEETWWVDADLGREPDQATGTAAFGRHGGDHEHRVVQTRYDPFENVVRAILMVDFHLLTVLVGAGPTESSRGRVFAGGR